MPIGKRAFLLRGFALPCAKEVLAAVQAVQAFAPFRHMITPGGFTMSVQLTNCGRLGWTADRRGYRYTKADPAPIVSVSLGMTATFLFGGLQRADRASKISLHHGDVVVWGGEDRLRFHGVMPLKGDAHPLLGHERINLTFRKAG